jgi:hypothetical protein
VNARRVLGTVVLLLAVAGVVSRVALAGRTSPRAATGTAAPASAPLGAGELATVSRRALALVRGRPVALGYRIRLVAAGGPVRAQTDRARRLITVFVRHWDPAQRVAHDIAHELGHAYDDRRLDDAQRAAYLRLRGVPHAAWWPHGALADYGVGAGDFAEVFALCHAASPEFRSTLAPRPQDPCAVLPAGARSIGMGAR